MPSTKVGTYAIHAYEVSNNMYARLNSNKAVLGAADVWYGPQALIPRYPAIIVEPQPKRRSYVGTHRFKLIFTVGIFVYHGKVQGSELNRQENEQAASVVEDFIHQDLTLGGLVVAGYVTLVEPGIVFRGEVMVTSTRLTWQGESREGF